MASLDVYAGESALLDAIESGRNFGRRIETDRKELPNSPSQRRHVPGRSLGLHQILDGRAADSRDLVKVIFGIDSSEIRSGRGQR